MSADRYRQLADVGQAVLRNRQLLDLIAGQPQRGRPSVERLVDLVAGALVRHPRGQPGELGQRRLPVEPGEQAHRRVGQLRAGRTDTRQPV